MASRTYILRSLKKSTEVPVETKVTGTIPKWLNGTLYRNGPGRYDFDGKTYDHVFDGQACIHKFAIANGQVKYTNKLLESQSYTKTLNENRLYPTFGTADLQSNLITRVKNFLKSPDHLDNTNVHVVPFGKSQLYAMTEVSRMSRLNPSDLSIMNTTNLSTYLPDLKTAVAHPHLEKDGGWINCGVSVRKGKAFYTVIRYRGVESNSACEQAEVIAEIPSTHEDGFGYFHSFAVTENYVILLESPLKISFKHVLLSVLKNLPKVSAWQRDDSFPTRIHVVDKNTGEILPQQFVTEPQFTFHHMNAYEQKESDNNVKLMVDISSYDSSTFEINSLALKSYGTTDSKDLALDQRISAFAKRIEVPINRNDKSKSEVYCKTVQLNPDFAFDFPMINYFGNNGRDYKYVYGINQNYGSAVSVTKMDVTNPLEIIEFAYDDEKQSQMCNPSEPVFVARPNAESEDDGVLLVKVLATDCDYLSILDARDLKELARADMPKDVRGAFCFHGFFADNQTYKDLNV